jgi:hypothetical protein
VVNKSARRDPPPANEFAAGKTQCPPAGTGSRGFHGDVVRPRRLAESPSNSPLSPRNEGGGVGGGARRGRQPNACRRFVIHRPPNLPQQFWGRREPERAEGAPASRADPCLHAAAGGGAVVNKSARRDPPPANEFAAGKTQSPPARTGSRGFHGDVVRPRRLAESPSNSPLSPRNEGGGVGGGARRGRQPNACRRFVIHRPPNLPQQLWGRCEPERAEGAPASRGDLCLHAIEFSPSPAQRGRGSGGGGSRGRSGMLFEAPQTWRLRR